MPSTSLLSDTHITRRRLLAGLGTAVTGSFTGCSGQLPTTGPARVNAELTVEQDQDPRLLWQYPPREEEKDGIGYAAVEINRIIQREDRYPEISLTFNSTIGGIASDEPYTGYHPEWFRFRIWPPTTYEGRLNHNVRVEPPGQWEGFSTYYDIESEVRRTTVELQDVETQGTVMIPAVFDPGMSGLPDQLHCSFTVQASRPGFLGKTIRVSEQGSLPITQE